MSVCLARDRQLLSNGHTNHKWDIICGGHRSSGGAGTAATGEANTGHIFILEGVGRHFLFLSIEKSLTLIFIC